MKSFLFFVTMLLSFSNQAQSIEDVVYLINLSRMSTNDAVSDINDKFESVSYFTEGSNHILNVPDKTFIITERSSGNLVTLVHDDKSNQDKLFQSIKSYFGTAPTQQDLSNGATSYRFNTCACVFCLLYDPANSVYAITGYNY